jgi:RNA polymerase sigma factor (sigma-70 family)
VEDDVSGRPARPISDRALEAVTEQRERLVSGIMATCAVDRAAAEDLLQDVWVQVLDRGVSTDPESWFHYLRVAARNRHLDQRRSAARAEARAAVAATPQYLMPNKDSVVETVAGRMLLLDGLDDLAALPGRERSAFVLRYYFDLLPAGIGEEMGITPKQVDNLLQQAKARLAKRRAAREGSVAYALLALILQPVTRDNSQVVSGSTMSVVSLAAAVAFSMVAVVSGAGAPAAVPPHRTTVTGAAASPSRGSPAGTRPGPSVGVVGEGVVGASSPAAEPAGGRSPFAGLLPDVPLPAPCVARFCVGGANPPGAGDTLTVSVAGVERSVSQNVVPVCEHVPANPVVRCTRQEPERWYVQEVAPPPSGGAAP